MALKNSSRNPDHFTQTILSWFDQHGRHDLPWQHPRSAYRVWLSEIMLQQTQVSTVIPYFERFLTSFPDILSLANASSDAVLHHWSGLGYYARARNLHKAAQQIRDQHGGEFPQDYAAIVALPGIGRSTAGAILAQAFEQAYPILDGNVKRVLTRYHAIAGWPGKRDIETKLWELAQTHTPQQRVADYTQAIMDLGATLCTRSKPRCAECPVTSRCQAYQQGNPADYPTRKPKKTIPVRQTTMLLLQDKQGRILLQQRPPSGIWGGLWCFPECSAQDDIADWCQRHLQLQISHSENLQPIRHTFSHFHLDITPVSAKVTNHCGTKESDCEVWYDRSQPDQVGLPAPIKQLLDSLDYS